MCTQYAAWGGHTELCKFLIDNGADVNTMGLQSSCDSPLMIATVASIYGGRPGTCAVDSFNILLRAGGDPFAGSTTEYGFFFCPFQCIMMSHETVITATNPFDYKADTVVGAFETYAVFRNGLPRGSHGHLWKYSATQTLA
jgi:hypothetical protein